MDKAQIFIILGDEAYQKEAILEIIKNKGGNRSNLDTYECSKYTWNKIEESVKTYSLFGTPRFFLIPNVTIFLQDEATEELLSECENFIADNNLENAYKSLVKAISSLALSQEEYNDIKSDISLLKTYLSDYTQNLDFVDIILKRYTLPDVYNPATSINFDDIFNNIPEGHFVIITAEKWDKRTKNYKAFHKRGIIYEKQSQKLSPREIKNLKEKQVDEFIKLNNLKISKETLVLLKERALETDILTPTLNKLSLIVGEKKEILKEDVESAFDDDFIPEIQNLSEFIRKREIAGIFKIICSTKNVKSDYIKLTGYLKSLLRNAIILKELVKTDDFKDYSDFEKHFYRKNINNYMKTQHPYYLFQCMITLKGFSIQHLENAYIKLFEIEKALKSSQKSPLDIFTDFFAYLFFNPKSL